MVSCCESDTGILAVSRKMNFPWLFSCRSSWILRLLAPNYHIHWSQFILHVQRVTSTSNDMIFNTNGIIWASKFELSVAGKDVHSSWAVGICLNSLELLQIYKGHQDFFRDDNCVSVCSLILLQKIRGVYVSNI